MNSLKQPTLLFLFIAFSFLPAFGQEQEERVFSQNILKIIPFELTSNTFMLELETLNKSLDRSISFGVGITYGPQYEGEEFGIRGEVIRRFYIKGLSSSSSNRNQEPYIKNKPPYMRGVYAAFFARGGYHEATEAFYYYNQNNFSGNYQENTRSGGWFFPGVMIGAMRTYWDVLVVEAYVGAGIRMSSITNSNPRFEDSYSYGRDVFDIGYRGVAPNLGIKIGLNL